MSAPTPRVISLIPLICGIMFAGGIMLGSKINSRPAQDGSNGADKIRAVMSYVKKNYVDSIDEDKLTDQALVSMLQTLDPHSDYFTAAQVKEMNEPMQGNFEGVGIEYNFVHDTIVVMVVIPYGPSETAGLKPGDKLLSANDTSIVGYTNKEDYVKSRLRGPSKTKVKVAYERPGVAGIQTTWITRGSIPIYSIDAYYMMTSDIGYMRITRFSETTFEEFERARDTLLSKGMKKMVLDIRANGGGLMDAATSIADEFLPDGKLIVFTKGRTDGEQRTTATKNGKLENIPLTVLVDENSASASEILAGALQDNDRATIIGRRTFGKGLVQVQQGLVDGSAFRLTIARYYTPTGRCIQKPYDKGLAAYESDELNRYKHGELYSRDSIHFPDSLKYKTPGGKIVYGGGGIMPDNFIPLDTTGSSHYIDQLFRKDVFVMWALNYSFAEGKNWRSGGIEKFRKEFTVDDAMLAKFTALGEQNGVKVDVADLKRSSDVIKRYMRATLARLFWGDAAFSIIVNDADTAVLNAVQELNK